jgi:hypothetical protein
MTDPITISPAKETANLLENEPPKVYEGTRRPLRLVKKTVEYRCGCEMVLSFYGPKECCNFCLEHGKGIKRIVTEEIFPE